MKIPAALLKHLQDDALNMGTVVVGGYGKYSSHKQCSPYQVLALMSGFCNLGFQQDMERELTDV